jgi:hypothetical protein
MVVQCQQRKRQLACWAATKELTDPELPLQQSLAVETHTETGSNWFVRQTVPAGRRYVNDLATRQNTH